MAEKVSRDTLTNGILARLSQGDFQLLAQHLETVKLPLRKRLENRNRRIEHVYFIEHGMASVVANSSAEREIEVGVIGREGMSGLAVIMGADRSPYETYMQMAGDGWCMKASNLRLRMAESATLREALLRYGYSFVIQTTQTSVANGRNKIEERLARWLLMANDRLDGSAMDLTHEFLAMMLCVRRPGVTIALQLLEKRGFIRTSRRAIAILDREGLRTISNGAYGAPEAEYRRLFG